jgi:hypothetical protein
MTEAVADIMASKCKIVPLITKELPAKYAYKLITTCINTRPTYIARITHPSHTLAAAREFDKVIDNGIASICSYPTELPTRAKIVRGLPQKLGGLSIRRIEDICETGFASSFLESLPAVHENIWKLVGPHTDVVLQHYNDTLKRIVPTFLSLDPTNPAIIDRPETTPMPDSLRLTINQAEEAALQEVTDADDPIPESPPPNPVSQSELTNIQDKARFLALFNDLNNFPKHRAWLQSGRDRNTAIWTRYTIGNNPWATLSSEAFTTAFRCRLLMPLLTTAGVSHIKCKRCKTILIPDDATYHAIECASRTDLITKRHNALRDIVYDFLIRTLPARDVHKEVSLAAEIQGKPDKRADITVRIGNQTFWIDITAGTPKSSTKRK